jgi:hypothetical protein
MHMSALKALGLSPDDSSIPLSKVSNITTDSASTMVSTGDILSKDYRLFLNMTWTPCSSHALNLVLQDQICTMNILNYCSSTVNSVHKLYRSCYAVEDSIPEEDVEDCKRCRYCAEAWTWKEAVHEV